MTGEQDEITAIREVLKARTAVLNAIADGPLSTEDDAAFAKRVQKLARAALTGEVAQ